MTLVELVPEYKPNGTVVLHAVVIGPMERLRRFAQRVLRSI